LRVTRRDPAGTLPDAYEPDLGAGGLHSQIYAPRLVDGGNTASHSYLMKKPGYYLSEEAYIERLRKELSLTPNGRFPLTWIMEAADDISYCVADLEDAVEKRIFSVEELYQHLYVAWGKHEKGSLFAQVVENAWEKSRSNSLPQHGRSVLYVFAGQYIK
jgi:dGTPase